jgi:hypothetical protein
VFLFLLTASAHAATYYVSTSGDDGVSCGSAQNISSPKRSITAGISCLQGGGDTLFIRGGTYNEVVEPVTASGTSWENPIWIGAYQSEVVTITIPWPITKN